jgi:hypothetical protein
MCTEVKWPKLITRFKEAPKSLVWMYTARVFMVPSALHFPFYFISRKTTQPATANFLELL